uniref:Uncharacterized protein n=1 Tax=Borely moumouvirus TaxID=2712067 RepID=A0A6G6ABF2_9VIRU
MSNYFKKFNSERLVDLTIDGISFFVGIYAFRFFYIDPKFNDYESRIRKLNSRVNYLESKTKNLQ